MTGLQNEVANTSYTLKPTVPRASYRNCFFSFFNSPEEGKRGTPASMALGKLNLG